MLLNTGALFVANAADSTRRHGPCRQIVIDDGRAPLQARCAKQLTWTANHPSYNRPLLRGAAAQRLVEILPILALTAFVSAVVFVARYEPVANKQYYPQCGFKETTGFDCPIAVACAPLMRLPVVEY